MGVKKTDIRLYGGGAEVKITYEDGEVGHFVVSPEIVQEHPSVMEAAEYLAAKRRNPRPSLSYLGIGASGRGARQRRKEPAAPPVLAELFIAFLAPKNSAQALLGCLQEMFQKNAERFGERQARRKYWMEVARSIRPLLLEWAKRTAVISFIIDYVRSKMGCSARFT